MKNIAATLFFYAIATVNAEDFCDASLCSDGQQQVACNKPVGFGPQCPADKREEIVMTPDLQQLIVSLHNQRRSKVAMGSLTSFPSAANMLEMVIDNIYLNLYIICK